MLDFVCGVIAIGMALGLISVGITGAPSVTIVIVQIGSLLAVFFAVLRIERKKISWVNKYQRGFYRLWMAFSSLLGVAVIIAWLAENLDVERLGDGGKVVFCVFSRHSLYHRVYDRAWGVLNRLVDYSGLPMSRVKRLPIMLVNEGRGFGNCSMRSLFCLLWRASRLVSLFPA